MRTSAKIRADIGTTRTKIAKWAGVSVPTLARYELKPDAVRDDSKRVSCERVYEVLDHALDQLEQEAVRGQSARDVSGAGADRGRKAQRRSG